ncbi:MAG: ATP synthase subunit I [Desulfomonilia bacterium]|jgi:F1F0 ATPase subunit 2
MGGAYYLVFTFGAGMALGAFFSLNLWSSVRRMTDEQTPWYFMYSSFMLRILVVVLGFYLVMAGRWERLVAAFLGFVLVREIMVRRLGRKPKVS